MKSPKKNNVNYRCKGEHATLQEILNYLRLHPTRIHLGQAPLIVWSMCSTNGIRTSPLTIAIMDFLNAALGEPEGGVTKFSISDKIIHSKGYEEKYAEIENIQNFTECGWREGNTLSKIRRKVPEKTPAEVAASEAQKRQMLTRDKQLKLDRKEICSNGLVDRQVKTYKESLEKLNQLEVIKSLPQRSIHSNNLLIWLSGMGMAEGCIHVVRADVAQHNHSFNAALSQAVTPYIGRLGVNQTRTYTTSCLQTVIFLLTVGMHYSHRKDQVIIALFYHLFCSHLATGVNVDLQFIKEKITKKWQSMDNDKKSKHEATVKDWMNDEGRNREYDENNGFIDDNEIESTLKVLEKVLFKLLRALKNKDPS